MIPNIILAVSMPITVICGLDRGATFAAGRMLLGGRSDAYLVTHCLDQIQLGLISRTTMSGSGAVDAVILDLAHGCVSCTLREDVLPNLRQLAASSAVDRAVLVLPEAVEPIGFLESFHFVSDDTGGTAADACHIEAVVAVVNPAELVPLLSNDETLADRGLNVGETDDRGLGDLIVGQVECADLVIAPDASAQEWSLLQLLNPQASLATAMPDLVPATFDFGSTSSRTSPALVDHLGLTCQFDGAWLLHWTTDRMLHPGRLHDALEGIAEVALRGRGHFQVATRPTAVVEWDSVGRRLRLGSPDVDVPATGTRLSFVGVSDRSEAIVDALNHAQLTDDEMTAPAASWKAHEDPFIDIWLSALNPEEEL